MKIARLNGRAHLVFDDGIVDIAEASDGRFPSEVEALLKNMDELQSWYADGSFEKDTGETDATLLADLKKLDAPVLSPSQIFAIGLNYKAHSDEAGMEVPVEPMVFTKFASSLAGPGVDVNLTSDKVDWEVEMVAIIGKPGRNISIESAMEHVAGFCVGQDISDRAMQFISSPAQFSLAKSFENFAPIGPWITTTDEVDWANVAISCKSQHEVLQDGHTSQMIFDVPTLISYLSNVCELRTGDLVFTGTPDGVGLGRDPERYIKPGWIVETKIDGLGRLENRFV